MCISSGLPVQSCSQGGLVKRLTATGSLLTWLLHTRNVCSQNCLFLVDWVSYRLVRTALMLWGSLISTHTANTCCFLLWRYLTRTGDAVDVPKWSRSTRRTDRWLVKRNDAVFAGRLKGGLPSHIEAALTFETNNCHCHFLFYVDSNLFHFFFLL